MAFESRGRHHAHAADRSGAMSSAHAVSGTIRSSRTIRNRSDAWNNKFGSHECGQCLCLCGGSTATLGLLPLSLRGRSTPRPLPRGHDRRHATCRTVGASSPPPPPDGCHLARLTVPPAISSSGHGFAGTRCTLGPRKRRDVPLEGIPVRSLHSLATSPRTTGYGSDSGVGGWPSETSSGPIQGH